MIDKNKKMKKPPSLSFPEWGIGGVIPDLQAQ
jgi:hypothetical protein